MKYIPRRRIYRIINCIIIVLLFAFEVFLSYLATHAMDKIERPEEIVSNYEKLQKVIFIEEEIIPYETHEVVTKNAADDLKLIIQNGKNGKITTTTTYNFTYRYGGNILAKSVYTEKVDPVDKLVKVGIEKKESPWLVFLATSYSTKIYDDRGNVVEYKSGTGNRGATLTYEHSIAMWQSADNTIYTNYAKLCKNQKFIDFYTNLIVDTAKCSLPYGTVVNLRVWDGTKYKYLYNLTVLDDSPTTQYALTYRAQHLEEFLKYDKLEGNWKFSYSIPYSRTGEYAYKSSDVYFGAQYTGCISNWKEEYSGKVCGWLDIYSKSFDGIFMVEIQVQE